MSDRGPFTISISAGTVLMAIGLLLLVWLLYILKDLVLIVLTAIVLASAVEPGVAWFMRYKLPRVASVGAVYVIILGVLFTVAYLFFPPLITELRDFAVTLPQYLDSVNATGLDTSGISSISSPLSTETITSTLFQLQEVFTSTGEGAFRALSGIFGGVVSFVLIIVLSIYFAIQETGVDDFLRIVVPVKYQEYAVNLWKRSHAKIGLWMQGQILLSLLMGVMAYLWLTILGVPYSMVLAVVVALAELIPIFGPILSGTIAVAVAFSTGDTSTALLVAGGFLVLHQLENHLIYPLVVKKVVGVAPILVILALIAGLQLAGFLGVLLSVPIAAAIQEFVTDIQRRNERELRATKS